LGERAAVEWPQRCFFASARPNETASNARPDLVADADPEEVRRRDLGPDHTPTSGGRVLPAHPADPRPVDPRLTVAGDLGKPYDSLSFLFFLLSLSFFFFYPGHGKTA
jgi:hypothetical protein